VSDRACAIVRAAKPPRPADVVAAEARVRALAEEVAALGAAVDAFTAELAAFERAYAAVTAEAFAELSAAERLVRHIARLHEEVERLAAALRASSSSPADRERAGRRSAPGGGANVAPRVARQPASPTPLEGERAGERGGRLCPDLGELDLKGLRRRLARLLHPDLARDESSARTRGSLLAVVNDAYARRDRTALELLAERLGAADLEGEPTDDARRAHLARREAALAAARDPLLREVARLRSSATARTREAVERRRAEGGDHAAGARDAALDRAAAAREEALSAIDGLAGDARALVELRGSRRGAHAKGARRRAGDPILRSPHVRAAAAPLDPRRASPAARRLAAALSKDAALDVPWAAALTLFAFFAEAATHPPAALATRAALEERWDALRARWPSSPDLGRALARLPRHLEVGLRVAGESIEAGLQLASADLAAGVRLAFEHEPVRELARAALAVLGPRQRCSACGEEGYAVHFVRTRGLDDIHALACARCGAVLRSFWRYGPPEGLEALAPFAVEVGALAEVSVRLAGAAIAFQLLPGERARLTIGDLERRLRELLLSPHGIEPPTGALAFHAGRARLAPHLPVPSGRALSARLEPGLELGGVADAAELLAWLRARIARRFAG
jgi:hypothetical protein